MGSSSTTRIVGWSVFPSIRSENGNADRSFAIAGVQQDAEKRIQHGKDTQLPSRGRDSHPLRCDGKDHSEWIERLVWKSTMFRHFREAPARRRLRFLLALHGSVFSSPTVHAVATMHARDREHQRGRR